MGELESEISASFCLCGEPLSSDQPQRIRGTEAIFFAWTRPHNSAKSQFGSSLYGVGKEWFVSLGATLRTLRLCGFTSQTLVIASVLRPFNRRGAERTEDYGKIVGFLRQAHEPTENSDEPSFPFSMLQAFFWTYEGRTATLRSFPNSSAIWSSHLPGIPGSLFIASLMFFRASSTLSPWERHPGSAGQLTMQPPLRPPEIRL